MKIDKPEGPPREPADWLDVQHQLEKARRSVADLRSRNLKLIADLRRHEERTSRYQQLVLALEVIARHAARIRMSTTWKLGRLFVSLYHKLFHHSLVPTSLDKIDGVLDHALASRQSGRLSEVRTATASSPLLSCGTIPLD